MKDERFILVDKAVLPDVFEKVLIAKSLLLNEDAKTLTDACKKAHISRSAFYKYKDSVFLYEGNDDTNIVTYSFMLSDQNGVLSNLISRLAMFKVNIVTINQNIPVDKVAVVIISFKISDDINLDEIQEELKKISGVLKLKQI